MKIAAITMAYNDPVFLPIWVEYYGKNFGLSNLFVVDHGSDINYSLASDVNLIKIPRDKLDEDNRALFISDLHSALLRYYDVVVFSDCDEFLIADPLLFENLSIYIEKKCETVCTAVGLNLIHIFDIEAPIDLSKPILGQRKYARFRSEYCKTLIGNTPIRWGVGFHSSDHPRLIDETLFLFHLKLFDVDIFRNMHKSRSKILFSENALKKGHGVQWRHETESSIRSHFTINSSNLAARLSENFKFSENISTIQSDAESGVMFFDGVISKIPSCFFDKIPGVHSDLKSNVEKNSMSGVGDLTFWTRRYGL